MDWVTAITQVSTLVTILLVFFTLLEMKNQRKATLKPDLMITSEVSFHAYKDRDNSSIYTDLPIAKLCSPQAHAKWSEDVWETVPHFKFYNVGFGVAKNIKLKWACNYDRPIKQIKDYCYQNSIPLILQLSKSEDELVITGLMREEKAHLSLSSDEDTADYLMPASITSDGMKSSVSHTAFNLISIIMYLKGHHANRFREQGSKFKSESELMIDFPNMKLEVHYDDVEDSHYSKTFDVKLFPYFYTSRLDASKETEFLWSGTFQFKSRKKAFSKIKE